jgi:peroxiredoxin
MAPGFKLPSASGPDQSMESESYIGNRNLVVVFYRAFW